MSDAILLRCDGPVATITLNRPEKRNALEIADMRAFAQALADAHARPALRALVVTGAGERAFCSGASLGDVARADWTENPLTALCDGLEAFPLPTICALNGGAYGGGLEIALACDFRVGFPEMRAFIPPARLGIHYEAEGIARLMRVLGPQVARRLLLAAETLEGPALLASGLLDRVTTQDKVAQEAAAMAAEIATLAPLAVQGMKRTIFELGCGALDREAARARIAQAWASEDLQEGLAAMRDKRKAAFNGR